VDDLITWLQQSGYGIHISQVFFWCLLYADNIALLSSSCYGLQKLIDICSQFGFEWDIKFNPSIRMRANAKRGRECVQPLIVRA